MNLYSRAVLIPALLLVCTTGAGQYETKPRSERGPAFRWPDGKRAALSLTFDDARVSQVDAGVPLFDREGVKVTFFVSPARMRDRLELWKKAAASGHEIANHSMTHPCSGNFPFARERALEDFTLDRMRAEMTDANKSVEQMIGVVPRTFAYPCGQKFVGRGRDLKSYVPLVAELFVAGRGWMDEAANDPALCDLAQLFGLPSDNVGFEVLRPLLEQAQQQGSWLVLAGHDIGNSAQRQTTQISMLEELLRYARDPARGIWLDTFGNVAAYVQNRRAARASAGDSIADRVERLVAQLTLEEKIGQINMPCVYVDELGEDVAAKTEACRKFAEGTYEAGVGPGGGFFTLANNILLKGPRQQAEYFNSLQRIALEKTRMKIPLLQTEEGTHGLMCSGGTIFPEGLALGSMWNPALLKEIYTVAAREARAVGIHQLFTLVIEPNRDPRLGRNEEGYSEDPWLCSRFAEAIVSGVQGSDISAPDKVVAGLCHYPGQSQPASGLERGAMEISARTLHEVFLPPWVAGIRDRGALGVMATYPAIDGIPVHGSNDILTRLLRHELGFAGLVLSEGSGISTLLYEGLAATPKEAGQLALKAGVDVGISYEQAFMRLLADSVREGRVPMEVLDRAVRRVLTQKMKLGLFDRPPYVDPDRAAAVVHAPEHVDLALKSAREGIVLLKNDAGLLPLGKDLKSIAVIGPNADNERNQLGDYTSKSILQDIVTILDGIRVRMPDAEISYVKGCDVTGAGVNEFEQARAAARKAQVAIVVVGENEWNAPLKTGTNGEGYDVATLELTGLQEQLVRTVFETGTPTVVVLVAGRPMAIRWIAEHVPAIVQPWMCGERGGEAVADVLFGDYNPSGRLPITVPRHAGQYPFYYNYKPSKAYWLKHAWGKPYADLSPEPLFHFGHGLSFTDFSYANLKIEQPKILRDGKANVRVDVRNTGKVAGDEVVQLYLRDAVSSVTTPVKQLRGFEKLHLRPGETRTVTFTLGPAELALLDREMRWTVEPGTFEVMVGRSSADIRVTGTFEVVGD